MPLPQNAPPNSEFLPFGKDIIPQLSIDCVIFGFHEHELKVLLLKWKNLDYWALPGGFVFQWDSIDAAAKRIAAAVVIRRHDIGLEEIVRRLHLPLAEVRTGLKLT